MPSLAIFGDSNSGGVANVLAEMVPSYRSAWIVENYAVGAQQSTAGVRSVRDVIVSHQPTVAICCWGGADAMHHWHTAHREFWPPNFAWEDAGSLDGAVANMLLAQTLLERANVRVILARGVGSLRTVHPDLPPTSPARPMMTQFLPWFDVAYKRIADRWRLYATRPLLALDGSNQGYHVGQDPRDWALDGIHCRRHTYERLACRVMQYLTHHGLW